MNFDEILSICIIRIVKIWFEVHYIKVKYKMQVQPDICISPVMWLSYSSFCGQQNYKIIPNNSEPYFFCHTGTLALMILITLLSIQDQLKLSIRTKLSNYPTCAFVHNELHISEMVIWYLQGLKSLKSIVILALNVYTWFIEQSPSFCNLFDGHFSFHPLC